MSETPSIKDTPPRMTRPSKKNVVVIDAGCNPKAAKTSTRNAKVAVVREKTTGDQPKASKKNLRDRSSRNSKKEDTASTQTLPDGSAPNFGGPAKSKRAGQSAAPQPSSLSEKPNPPSQSTPKEGKARTSSPKGSTQTLPNGQKVNFGGSERVSSGKSRGGAKGGVTAEDMGKYAGSSFHVSPAALDLPKPSFKKVSSADASPPSSSNTRPSLSSTGYPPLDAEPEGVHHTTNGGNLVVSLANSRAPGPGGSQGPQHGPYHGMHQITHQPGSSAGLTAPIRLVPSTGPPAGPPAGPYHHPTGPAILSAPVAYANMPMNMHPGFMHYAPYSPAPMMPVQPYPVQPYGYQPFPAMYQPPPPPPPHLFPTGPNPVGHKMTFNELIASHDRP